MGRKFLRELGEILKKIEVGALVALSTAVIGLVQGFRVSNPILFGFTIFVIILGEIIGFQLIGNLLISLSKKGYVPIDIILPARSNLNPLTFGKGIHSFFIRNRDPYDKIENCYVKLISVDGLLESGHLPMFSESTYSRRLLWQGWALSDGAVSIGNNDQETLNIIEVGNHKFRFLFYGETTDEDCDSSDLGLGEGFYEFKIRVFGQVRKEVFDIEKSYIAKFETALDMQSHGSTISHLILWERQEFLQRQKDGFKETPTETEAKEKFRERLNKQAKVLLNEKHSKDRIENANQENKINIPKFYTHTHHAEFTIKGSDANNVANYIFQYLDDIPMFVEEGNFYIETQGGSYYNPEKDGIPQHAFVARGRKSIAKHGYFHVGQFKMTADPDLIDIPEMFFITVVQGGQNTAQVKFDTEEKDVFLPYAKALLKELEKAFEVTYVDGLLIEPDITLTPSEDGELEFKEGEVYKVARMRVLNNTSKEITKCFATLQHAEDIIISQGTPGKIPLIPSITNINRPDRIAWNESQDMNEQCEIAIPLKDARNLDIADTLRSFHYNLRKGKIDANWVSVLHTVKIRIDYVIAAQSKFVEFEGYIYAANHGDPSLFNAKGKKRKPEEITKDRIQNLKMKFKHGNWMDDKEIKQYMGMENTRHDQKNNSNEAEPPSEPIR